MRMALGAAPAGVVSMVLGRVALLVGLGVAAGIAASLWALSLVPCLQASTATIRWTMTAAAIALGAIGAFAGWIPPYARHASTRRGCSGM